ncbi:MAG: glycosyltransferase family 4 protein [Planctomycetota bacterium]
MRPKALLICGYFPYPEAFGTSLRLRAVADALSDSHDVGLIVVNEMPPGDDEVSACRERFASVDWYRTVQNAGSRGIANKVRRALDTRWIQGRDALISEADRAALEAAVQGAAVTWVHSLRVADRAGVDLWPRTVIDVDDLHSVKFEQEADLAASRGKSLQHRWTASLWGRWERDAMRRFPVAAVCSPDDRSRLGRSPSEIDRIAVVPNGFETPVSDPERSFEDSGTLGMIGTLRYHANVDGLVWFCREALPRIAERRPGVRLRVIGRLPDGGAPVHDDRIEFLGYVDDPAAEMATWGASVVPLRIGGGTRLKILDAFSRRCPVVATPLGAFGLGAESGHELLLAEDPEAFARACLDVMCDPELARGLTDAGLKLLRERFDWERIKPAIREAASKAAGS